MYKSNRYVSIRDEESVTEKKGTESLIYTLQDPSDLGLRRKASKEITTREIIM